MIDYIKKEICPICNNTRLLNLFWPILRDNKYFIYVKCFDCKTNYKLLLPRPPYL